MNLLQKFKEEMQKLKNPEKAKLLSGYFKTGKGEYGEGDNFLGIMVPKQRKIASQFYNLGLDDLQNLLDSKVHEYRLTALFILVDKYQKAYNKAKKEIVDFYLKNTRNINNWDLVDLSAPRILGDYLLNQKIQKDFRALGNAKHFRHKNRKILYKLVRGHLWGKRIAVLATFMFIKHKQFDDSLKIAELLLKDKHDLIHKAVGWMLREIGKRDLKTEEIFLKKHCRQMPRTMLIYAIEKFDERKRKFYLKY